MRALVAEAPASRVSATERLVESFARASALPAEMTRPIEAHQPPISRHFEDMDTAVITLPPELLQALRSIAPKRKHPTIVYVLLLAVLTVGVAVAANRSMRDFLISEWQLRTSIAKSH
jgi:hypothetical protein